MATRRLNPLQTIKPDTVVTYAHFQFSGSAGPMANFSGSGFTGCYLSGTTYTLVANTAWPQLVGLSAQLAVDKSFLGTPSASLDVVFNGAQVDQFKRYYSGSAGAGTGSGQSQTIDFSVVQGTNGSPVAVPYLSGANWCYIQAVYLNNGYTRG